MPDILIRGVALPKYGCAGCYFKTGKYCGIISKNENVEEYSLRAERHPDCPIHELPPHGDLIDRDAFRAENEYYLNREFINPKYEDTLDDLLKNAPVVIPAEKGANHDNL